MLEDYTIERNKTNIDALKKIDQNKKGFLVVVEDGKLIGTLTDGDIRRAFISGKSFEDSIESEFIKNCRYIKASEDLLVMIELFKNSRINFLPIIDEEGYLLDIITKKQMQTLLLQDKTIKLSGNFTDIDESIVDHEVFHRPWGFYKTTVMNDYFQSKIISVHSGQCISLQSHNHREEYWTIAHGEGEAQIGESIISVSQGSYLFIPKGCKHRIKNTDKKESLILIEVQLGAYFGEDDIIRYEDNYGRC